jgi:hypothetical protein
MSTNEEENVETLDEDINDVKESLTLVDEISIRASARRSIFEEITMGQDSIQMIVSTKDLVSAKRIALSTRSQQHLEQLELGALVALTKDPNLVISATSERQEETGGYQWRAGKKLNQHGTFLVSSPVDEQYTTIWRQVRMRWFCVRISLTY